MKNLISAILECDRNAVKIIDDAKLEKERIEKSVFAETEALRAAAYGRADKELDILRDAERSAGIVRMNGIKEKQQKQLEEFERLYNENAEKWSDDILASVIDVQ